MQEAEWWGSLFRSPVRSIVEDINQLLSLFS